MAQPDSRQDRLEVCLLQPAFLPEWFWKPTAEELQRRGVASAIPTGLWEDTIETAEESVDAIEEHMQGHDWQYVVALSRGVELAVRYIDRLAQRQDLGRLAGWMVISSVGPRGYETKDPVTQALRPRHTNAFVTGLQTDEQGHETLDLDAAETCMLSDIDDDALRKSALAAMTSSRPLTDQDIKRVPRLPKNLLPLAWYIGRNDKVDNIELSASVATERFGVEPLYTDWGHIGPLSHTAEVADAIVTEMRAAAETRNS